jgi:crotonobetainyl-CoA:carnitine CoA-transferase CaiB-like acyl-CoA transferase
MAGLGFSYDELRAINPSIVLTSISNFGQSGPYRDLPASEIVLYGMGHSMFGTGQPDAEPMSMAPRVNLQFAGQTAAVATVGAVLASERDSDGDWIDVAIWETYASSVDRRSISLTAYDYTGEKMVRLASVSGLSAPPMFNICGDGYFHMSVGAPWWNTFVDAVNEDFLRDPKFAPPITDVAIREEFDSYWIPWCLQRTKKEISQIFQDRGMPVAPVNSVADLLTDPHLEIRGFFHDLLHPVAGRGRYPGVPFQMHGTPGVVRTPAPQLGQHNAQVYGEAGYTKDDLVVLAGAGVI